MPPTPNDRAKDRRAAAPGPGLLASFGAPTDVDSAEAEAYSPIPAGYRPGRHKYVAVFGTVMSGLGKGIFSSSVAKLVKDKGLVVAPIKMEGYLNFDSGTHTPFRHGEVFVLDDGTETDMDLGTYERMLDQDMTRRNFVTAGQIYSEILERERRGGYLGRDVQMIPHVTGEVKRRLRELALHGDGERPADVVFAEVGGTAGDYENGFYIEALRQIAFEEGPESVCFVALTYVIEPPALGEQKSKAAQLGIKRLMEAGIQPHIIACRASKPCTRSVLEKIAMFSNVPMKRVFSMHDRPSIYSIPDAIRAAGLDRQVLSILGLHDRVDAVEEDKSRADWLTFVSSLASKDRRPIAIGLTGKYTSVRDAYASIDKALEHCSARLRADTEIRWIDTTDITDRSVAQRLEGLDAVIVPGGFGARGVEGKIACVRHCRENHIPLLGICYGFQIAVIEFARNVAGLAGASSTEFEAGCAHPVISELPEQKKIEQLGGSMRLGGQDVALTPGTLAHYLYAGASTVRERFRHRYEVDPAYVARLEAAGTVFSGRHPQHPIMQVLELPGPGAPRHAHPFFIAAQFHPELTGRPLRPQPLFMGLVAAALAKRHPDADVGRWRRPVVATPARPAPSGAASARCARSAPGSGGTGVSPVLSSLPSRPLARTRPPRRSTLTAPGAPAWRRSPGTSPS